MNSFNAVFFVQETGPLVFSHAIFSFVPVSVHSKPWLRTGR